MKYTSLILDMDGTIINSLDAVEGALRKAGEKWDVKITPELVDTALYSSNDELRRLLDMGAEVEGFLDDVAGFYHEMGHMSRFFPGIEALLNLPLPLGIVTNENRAELAMNFNRLGMRMEDFRGICCAGDTPYIKPHPYPLENCIEQMGVTADTTIYLGDSTADLFCAKAAGVPFGLALWGVRDSSLFRDAEYIFREPGDVLEVLEL